MTFSFLSQSVVPRPVVTLAQAETTALQRYGNSGDLRELGSQQDRNYLVQTTDEAFLLKFSNPAFSDTELDSQNSAMAYLGAAGLVVPEVIPGLDGELVQRVELNGQSLAVRLMTFVPGQPLTDAGRLDSTQIQALGAMAGRVVAALTDFEHPGTQRSLQWDLRIASDVIELLAVKENDPRAQGSGRALAVRHGAVLAVASVAGERLSELAPQLRVQTIHGDLTDDNLVGDAEQAVTGVIDFGDLSQGWVVAELAIACASIIHHNPDEPLAMLEAVAAFDERMPLTDPEIAALWPLVVLRGAVLVVSGDEQVALDGDNEYVTANQAHEWGVFQTAATLDPDEVEFLIRARLSQHGHDGSADAPRSPDKVLYPLVEGLTADAIIDLSTTSAAFDGGRWQEPDIEHQIAADAFAKHGQAITRYGEFRLSRALADSPGERATLALGVELTLPAGSAILAPFDGIITQRGTSLVLRPAESTAAGDPRQSSTELWLDGVEAMTSVATVKAGQQIGSAGALVTVQLTTVHGIRPPFLVRPLVAERWHEICPDPSGLLGIDVAAPRCDSAAVLASRQATFATVQEHYYADPPQLERGWRHHLIDVRGQVYLDMVNNVAAVGHGHPRLAEAVARQWALLNTNSRFNYEALAEYSSRLAELAPYPLDTVFLVNSGSEAVDLALRLAQTYTGEPTILAVREAYHGWTCGADAVSSSIADNPRALERCPDWVQLLESPHQYRGKHRGSEAAAGYLADFADDLARLDAEGRGIAGFIAEPVFGNAGGVMLPDGYLAGIYAGIRRRGGLCIADEVQVGFGRLGEYFWGTEQQNVVPDIITVAKAMGNGHPLGAVITRRDIADHFAAEGSLFSSAGGSPVSCRVGLTVLDIMADERLVENAAVVGGHLKRRLEGLMAGHRMVGEVYGMGLYLGVELVADRESMTPATAAAAEVCDAMLREGCILQPTGDHKNVLKIKPPLCLTVASADYFVDALERVLSHPQFS